MSIVLNFNPETEAGLLAQAQANGMALDQYVLSLAEAAVGARGDAGSSAATREDAVRRMVEFGERHNLSLGEPVTRAFLHEEHRL